MTPDVQLARDCFNQALHNHIDVLAERENRAAVAQRKAVEALRAKERNEQLDLMNHAFGPVFDTYYPIFTEVWLAYENQLRHQVKWQGSMYRLYFSYPKSCADGPCYEMFVERDPDDSADEFDAWSTVRKTYSMAAKCDGEAWPDFLEFIIKCPPKGN